MGDGPATGGEPFEPDLTDDAASPPGPAFEQPTWEQARPNQPPPPGPESLHYGTVGAAPASPPPPPGSSYVPPVPGTTPYPPQNPRRGMSTTAKVIIAIVVALMLGIGACSVWFVQTITAPVDEANEFLALVDAGDYDGAVARTHAGCNQGMVAADLDRIFGGTDLDYDLKSSHIENNAATASGSLDLDGVPQVGIEVFLRKIDDAWRVCGVGINPTNTID